MRLVLDTQVWLDLLVFGDDAVEPLRRMIECGDAAVLATAAMRDEFQRVLAYPALHLSTDAQAQALARFDRIARIDAQPVTAPEAPRCRDPDDQMFIDLALARGVDALLSRDAEVLRLGSRLARYGVAVATPQAWLTLRSGRTP